MSKKRTWLVFGGVIVVLLAVLVSCAPAATPTPTAPAPVSTSAPAPATPTSKPTTPVATPSTQKIVMKACTSSAAVGGADTVPMQKYAEAVSQRTNGQVTIEVYGGGVLIATTQLLSGVRSEVIDIFSGSFSYWPGDLPFSADSTALPFAWDWNTVPQVLKELTPYLNDELAKQNAQILFYVPLENGLFSRKAINPDNPNLKGFNVRVFGGAWTKLAQLMGGTPITMGSAEVPVAISTGVIDAFFTSYGSYYAQALYGPAPYIVTTHGFINLATAPCIGVNRWNTLPKDIQQILMEEGAKVQSGVIAGSVAEVNQIIKNSVAKGGKDITLTPAQVKVWQDLSRPVWNDLITKYPDKGKAWIDTVNKIIGR